MVEVPAYRLKHVKDSIGDIRALLDGKKLSDVASNRVLSAALERFLERLSEASRHIPSQLKESFGADIAWKDIANLGNVLRHAYDRTDINVLWSAYENDLTPLERAVDAMLAAQGDNRSAT